MVLHRGNTESGRAGRGNFARWSARAVGVVGGLHEEGRRIVALYPQKGSEQHAFIRAFGGSEES